MVEAEPRRIVIVGDDRLAIEGLSHVLGSEIEPRHIVTAAPSDATVDEADVCIGDLGTNPPGPGELELPSGPRSSHSFRTELTLVKRSRPARAARS